MDHRKLGQTDLMIAPLALGGNVFGWTIDEKESFKIMDAFMGAGFNLIDTADVYSRWAPGNAGGESELIMGNWMKQRGNRNQVVVATKVGDDMGGGKNITKRYILEAVEKSLTRLQTDHIDLYQTHWDVESTPVEETLGAYDELVRSGKIRWIGTSNFTAERLLVSLAASKKNGWPAYQSLQPEYSLAARESFEKELETICLDNQVGVISYFSLASGFLTGKYRSEKDLEGSSRGRFVRKYMTPTGFKTLDALKRIADELNTTMSSVAIAWLISRPSVTAPIASATSLDQLDALIDAATVTLSPEQVKQLDNASEIIENY